MGLLAVTGVNCTQNHQCELAAQSVRASAPACVVSHVVRVLTVLNSLS